MWDFWEEQRLRYYKPLNNEGISKLHEQAQVIALIGKYRMPTIFLLKEGFYLKNLIMKFYWRVELHVFVSAKEDFMSTSEPRTNCVYRFMDQDGSVLYVGKCKSDGLD